MKKVRFESPEKFKHLKMSESECHSPRPYLGNQFRACPPDITSYQTLLPYSTDPVQRYDNSNSSPYPTVAKTNVDSTEKETVWRPSNDLDLSLLDTSFHEPRYPIHKVGVNASNTCHFRQNVTLAPLTNTCEGPRNIKVLKPIENNVTPPNVLVKDNSFFIRRDNLNKYNMNPLNVQLSKLAIGKENNPITVLHHKEHLAQAPIQEVPVECKVHKMPEKVNLSNNECGCYHCVKVIQRSPMSEQPQGCSGKVTHCKCSLPQPKTCSCEHKPQPQVQEIVKSCNCNKQQLPPNAVDKKTWMLERYQQQNDGTTEIQKQANVSKEKREPTVADLFKIIKLQNEQLQLLQEKVDKFITTRQNPQPTLTCTHTEHVAMTTNNTDKEQVKMSIGVMTSFEMVHTSTVINKEVLKQAENAQIQCSKSQISIKEVVSKPGSFNFLDGITPVNNQANNIQTDKEMGPDEKTLNEVSLYNVQVDNAITPLMSPEQTMYLDVRDYSESDADSVDKSNVGWTYYNKVMTHVNGMLQDSEMPSSASAMYRNMRQHCMQMQIDKTNVSVTKRVKFGDDPLGIHQPHIYQPAATDTSLKMKQLAAKYLNNAVAAPPVQRPPPKLALPADMSFATRNYMEKHQLLRALPSSSKPPLPNDIPRFLDITALKQQPKFL